MAISFSRPDPSSPAAVSTANFSVGRRGYEPDEVREFLRMVAAELARLQEREKFLERELRTAQRSAPSPAIALDEEVVTRMLGEEAARILSTAREAASQIKMRAEDGASRVLRDATDEAQRLREEADLESARRRQDAASDADAELQMAKQQGREMVNEARAYRERVLGELARRRELARQQIEQLVHGRDRLLNAFERARLAAVDVMAEMTPLGEPTEYVNLSPTTGPVPLMVPAAVQVLNEATISEPEPELEPEAASETEVEAAELYDEESHVDELHVDESRDDELHVDELHVDELHDDGGPLATVLSLFAGELVAETEVEADTGSRDHPVYDLDEAKPSVDDLFARLRAARADTVVQRATASVVVDGVGADADVTTAVPDVVEDGDATLAGAPDTVFQASPEAPAAEVHLDDTSFGRRDAALTPLIVAAARKLKRVLADEQNDVLHVLRGAEPVRALAMLLPPEPEHLQRYITSVEAELLRAALAGAASVDAGATDDHERAIVRHRALQPAFDALAAVMVAPLRERLERAIGDVGGDNGDLADSVRALYREWKTQRIDEHLDDVAQLAFGRGALVALVPGTPVCWSVDPGGPTCPDAEDNALAGVIGAGEAFPTDHTCAPAHEGCRCMLQLAPR